MIERFLKQTKFTSVEDYNKNLEFIIPEGFNFAYDVMDAWAEEKPDGLALLWTNDQGEEIRTTFRQLKEQTDQAASYLQTLGIGKNDPVMLILKRRYEWWVVMLALHKIGAIVIPATYLLTAKDIIYRAQAADIKMIVTIDDPIITGHVIEAMPGCPSVKTLAAVGSRIPEGWLDYRAEVAKCSTEWTKPTGDDYAGERDTMLMYFTSGTASHPKMVIHDYTLPIGHIVTAKYWQRVEEGTRHLTAVDSGWAKFAWGKIYGQWMCGAVIAAYDEEGHFEAAKLLRAMDRLQLTTFCAPPTIYRFLIKEDLSHFDFSRLKQCSIAGEPLNPEVYNQWMKITGLPLVEGFGQTETSVLIANFQPWIPIKPGSTGKFSPIFDLQLLDDDGNPCEDGVPGNIVVKNAVAERPVGLFREYYRAPDAMAKSWKNGDYYTGDMAWRDSDGYIWFVGRNDDVIKCSGYRISPFEVESALMEHPCVLECAVTAAPDPIRGQVVKATVVLAKQRGYVASPELAKELQNHVKKTTAPYKYPRIVEFVDELPKSISGKIQRGKIRENDSKA